MLNVHYLYQNRVLYNLKFIELDQNIELHEYIILFEDRLNLILINYIYIFIPFLWNTIGLFGLSSKAKSNYYNAFDSIPIS